MFDKGGPSGVTTPPLPSGVCVKWGDLDETEIAESAASGVTDSPSSGMDDTSSQKNSLAHFADQRAGANREGRTTPGRPHLPRIKTGRAQLQSRVTPPYKEANSRPSPTSPRSMKTGAQARDVAFGAARALQVGDNINKRPPWHVGGERTFHERTDQRNHTAPHLQEDARVVTAGLHHASNELQLCIESWRFEVAQVQLQVQAERTATAKARLAVEKARNQGRRLDIELAGQGWCGQSQVSGRFRSTCRPPT